MDLSLSLSRRLRILHLLQLNRWKFALNGVLILILASHHPKLRHSTTFWDTILSIGKGQPEDQRDLSTSSVSTQLFPREPTRGGVLINSNSSPLILPGNWKKFVYLNHIIWDEVISYLRFRCLCCCWCGEIGTSLLVMFLAWFAIRSAFSKGGGNSMNLKQLTAKGALSVHPLIIFWPSNKIRKLRKPELDY